ncbi:MAG: LysE/ArgO family amino acid transporter [Rhodobacteraceae bacterium]|nr:LysE/ArgO family amino acid transporter [Paracoccaceae bacterium]
MSTFLAGFGLGLSLIVAIGAQNAFILRAGLLRQHVFILCSVCAVSDALLIAAGVSGLEMLVGKAPFFLVFMKYAGASFLFAYGLRSLLKSFRGGRFLLAEGEAKSLKEAVIICLMLTWLNPHVYLDTVVFLGIASTQYNESMHFAAGAIISSFIFFYSLGFGARLLSKFFEHPVSWRILDGIIGIVMWSIAFSLVYDSQIL